MRQQRIKTLILLIICGLFFVSYKILEPVIGEYRRVAEVRSLLPHFVALLVVANDAKTADEEKREVRVY